MKITLASKFFLLRNFEELLLSWGSSQKLAEITAILAACLALWLLARILIFFGTRLLHLFITITTRRTNNVWYIFLEERKFFSRSMKLVIAVIILACLNIFFSGYMPSMVGVIRNIIFVFLVVISSLVLGSLLEAANDTYNTKPAARRRSIKGIIQTLKIAIYVIAGILVMAILIGKNPSQLLLGLGASAAIITLIFKDTILGFVASIQISAQDMIRPGDWIEMPSKGADGVVTDINVSNVKVRNWNNTITMIPIYSLVSDAFTNWRSMEEGKGRRFKRPLLIDLTSVQVLSNEQIERIYQHPSIAAGIMKMKEIAAQTNSSNFTTNLGLFRCYIEAYMLQHQQIAIDLPLAVRYLSNNENGVTVELYGFSTQKNMGPYEAVVVDIFNHIMGIAPVFLLRLYQRPAGAPAVDTIEDIELEASEHTSAGTR